MRVIDREAFGGVLDRLRAQGYEVVLPPRGDQSLLADRIDGAGDPVAMLTATRRSERGKPRRPRAFVGLRSCELHAVRAMDGILLAGNAYDPEYADSRRSAILIGVNCREPDSSCYCGAVGAGPRCTAGFDLALTEVPYGYLVEIGSEAGEALLLSVSSREASPDEVSAVDRLEAEARRNLRWQLDVLSPHPSLVTEPGDEWTAAGEEG